MNKEEIVAALLAGEGKPNKERRWANLLSENDSITDLFLEEGGASVALYEPERDAGNAALFIHELRLYGVSIDCAVTDDPAGRALAEEFGIACVSREDISAKVKADFVVILSSDDYYEYNRLRIGLLSRVPSEVISLQGLIDLQYARRIWAQYAGIYERGRFKNCLLAWSKVCRFNDIAVLDKMEGIQSVQEHRSNPERFKTLYSDIAEYSDDYIEEVFKERPVVRREGALVHADCAGRFVNIVNSLRMTVDSPDDADFGIYVAGGCTALGFGTDDRYTIASLLQKHINDYYGSSQGARYAVYNLGVWGADDIEYLDLFMKRDKKKKKLNLYVFRADLEYHSDGCGRLHRYIKKSLEQVGMDYIDLTSALYEAEKRGGAYLDTTHTNHRGYRAVADRVWSDYLKPILESEALSAGDPAGAYTPLEKWRALRETSHPVSDFFTGSGVRSAGLLYDPAKREMLSGFAADLTRSGVGVTLLTEGRVEDESPIPNVRQWSLDEAEAGEKPELDVVVRAGAEGFTGTEERIRGLLGAETVELNDVIGLVWDKYFFYPKIAEGLGGSAAHICVCFWPSVSDLDLPPAERARIAGAFANTDPMKHYAYLKTYLYNDLPSFTKEYLIEITKEDTGAEQTKNTDRKGSAVNVKDGVRRTVGQPAASERRVHLFGGGAAFGIGAEDRHTIASFLQEQMNLRAKRSNSAPVRVENEGVCRNSVRDLDIFDRRIAPKLRDGSVKDGDIVLWLIDRRYAVAESGISSAYLSGILEEYGVRFLDLTQAMRIAQEGPAFIDRKHVNQRGNKIVAMKLYMDYVKRVIEGGIPAPARRQKAAPPAAAAAATAEDAFGDDLTGEQNAEFREYLEYLAGERRSRLARAAEEKRGRKGPRRKAKYDARARKEGAGIGAVVMNCNPFTKGHRHLVERAAAATGFLYVFVVEEDRSFFPFDDRFRLVSEGLRDIPNVRVLRSGKFIISTITFPDYFTKESAKTVAVDTSLDLRLFGKFIAPALGIGTRFAGSEPTDAVTRQYNRAMKETLPQYGVEFVEFERIAEGDAAISASIVRALLERRDWDGIQKLVPDVTYNYLREKFGLSLP